MNIHLARHQGMCFGVRDALRAAHAAARRSPVTILGPLVHNPAVAQHLRMLGAQQGDLANPAAAPTRDVIITAHGAATSQVEALNLAGFRVTDTWPSAPLRAVTTAGR